MKRYFLKYTALALVGGLIFTTACKKDDPEIPVIEYDAPTVTVEGEKSIVLPHGADLAYEIEFTVEVVAEGTIEKVEIQRNYYLGEVLVEDYISEKSGVAGKTEATITQDELC